MNKDSAGTLEWVIKKIPPVVGSASLVGYCSRNGQMPDLPWSFGNYFSFSTGQYCMNMWKENFDEWARTNPVDDIEIVEINDNGNVFCIVIDDRIPKSWTNKSLYFVGCGKISPGLRYLASITREEWVR